MGYTAFHLPYPQHNKSNFETQDGAAKYIEGFLCCACHNDLKNGFITHDENEPENKTLVNNALDTDCGAEWSIIPDEEAQYEIPKA